MENNLEKANLRKILLEKRDGLSYDFIKLASKKIHDNLKKLEIYKKAKSVGSYFPIGSEVKTETIMLQVLKDGKKLSLPKVIGKKLSFRKITGFDELEKGIFEIMEPKDGCQVVDKMDIVLVPVIGITRSGIRLGYGYGYYDIYLSTFFAQSVGLTFSNQIVKAIPSSKKDIKLDWIITEDECFGTSIT